MGSNGQIKASREPKSETEKGLSVNRSDLLPLSTGKLSLNHVAEDEKNALSTEDFLKVKTSEAIAVYQVYIHCEYRLAMIAIEVKKKVGHGEFDNWLKNDLLKKVGLSYPTLHRWMRIARLFEEEFDGFDSSQFESFQDMALYHLTKRNVPKEARHEALLRAAEGEVITLDVAVTIAEQYLKKENELQSSESGFNESQVEPQESIIISSLPKPEIIAVRPSKTKVKEQAIKEDSWHQLGRHRLYCGYPNAPQFKKKLPKNVAAIFTFAPTPDWQLSSPCQAESTNTVYSKYEDFDYEQIFQTFLNVATESNDVLVCCYFPVPECLAIADHLGLICYVAEPNVERCQKIIEVWQTKKVLEV